MSALPTCHAASTGAAGVDADWAVLVSGLVRILANGRSGLCLTELGREEVADRLDWVGLRLPLPPADFAMYLHLGTFDGPSDPPLS